MTDPRAVATGQLAPGEHLLWSGQSDPRILFTGRDAFLIPFSLVWCGFMVSAIQSVLTDGEDLGFASIIFVFFVFIGLYMLIGRFIVKARRKRTDVFAVTDRRVFVTNGRSTRDTSVVRTDRTVRWSGGRKHCSVEWQTGGRGFGFRNNSAVAGMYANTGLDGFFGPREVAFWDVPDGEDLMRALDRAGSPPQH